MKVAIQKSGRVTEVLLLTTVTYLFDEDLSFPVEILER